MTEDVSERGGCYFPTRGGGLAAAGGGGGGLTPEGHSPVEQPLLLHMQPATTISIAEAGIFLGEGRGARQRCGAWRRKVNNKQTWQLAWHEQKGTGRCLKLHERYCVSVNVSVCV